MNTSNANSSVYVCVQFIVKQSQRLTALPVDFVAAAVAAFVVVITVVCELHA